MSDDLTENYTERSPERLAAFRKRMGMTQLGFGGYMGMPLRTYEDLEAGKVRVREIHMKAAEMAMITAVADGVHDDYLLAHRLPEYLKRMILDVAEKLR